MTLQKIFITGANGNSGLAAVKCLCEGYPDQFQIFAGIHFKPGQCISNQDILNEYQTMIETVYIDANSFSSVKSAFEGMNLVLIIPPDTLNKVEHAEIYIDAARECNVDYVLLLSMVNVDDPSYLYGHNFRAMELYLSKSHINKFSVLRCGFYFQNLYLFANCIRQNELPFPSGRFAPIDVESVGKVISFILTDPSNHVQRIYNLTGPSLLSGRDLANIFTLKTGKQVEWKDTTDADMIRILLHQGLPSHEIQGLLEFFHKIRKNELEEISHDFESITGQKPHSFEDFVEKNKRFFILD
jgi:uncharacterized protein YbjT (DUF2867 family)